MDQYICLNLAVNIFKLLPVLLLPTTLLQENIFTYMFAVFFSYFPTESSCKWKFWVRIEAWTSLRHLVHTVIIFLQNGFTGFHSHQQ